MTGSVTSLAADDLQHIRLLVLDFDGGLTDNRVIVDQHGTESVFCSRGDGMGVEMARESGLEIFVISKEQNPVVAARCNKLKLPMIQGCDDKLPALQRLAEERTLEREHIAFVGNDTNDRECVEWCGLGIAVADSHPGLLAVADRVTSLPGGRGAVREVCDLWRQSSARDSEAG